MPFDLGPETRASLAGAFGATVELHRVLPPGLPPCAGCEAYRALALAARFTAPRFHAFAWGRQVAHDALRLAGAGAAAAAPLLRDRFGAPLWPAGWTGSISHCDGHAVAAVLPAAAGVGIGIDVEHSDRPGVQGAVRRLCLVPGDAAAAGAIALFSAKEAAFKALHPHPGRPLWFTDIIIDRASCGGGALSWHLDGAATSGVGHQRHAANLIVTLAFAPAPAPCTPKMGEN